MSGACCNAVFFSKCDQAGNLVIVQVDPSTDTATYKNEDGSLFAGDPTTLNNCAGVDTYGTVQAAAAALVTTNGVSLATGQLYVSFPDGTTWSSLDTNTFGTVRTATVALTTTNGVSVAIGDQYVLFPDGTSWSSSGGGTDTFGTVETAAVALTTTNGVAVAIGEQYVLFPDATTWAGTDTNTFGTVTTAAAGLTTTNGVAITVGGEYVLFPDNTTWANADICERMSNATAADCADLPVDLATSDCDVKVSSDLITSKHALASCPRQTETVTGLTTGGTPPDPMALSFTSRPPQIGSFIAGPPGAGSINPADFVNRSWTDPGGALGDVRFIQLGWGSDSLHAGDTTTVTLSAAGVDLTYIGQISAWSSSTLGGDDSVRSDIYAYRIGTAATPVTVTVNWPNRDTVAVAYDDVFKPMVSTMTAPTFADIDFGSATILTAPGTDAGDGDVTSTPSTDFGDCDHAFFGVGRHVFIDPPQSPNIGDVDTNWSTPSAAGVTEIYDVASYSDFCQIGLTAGVIPGDTGPVSFQGRSNLTTQTKNMQWLALPIDCATAGDDTPYTTAACTLSLTNPNCTSNTVPDITTDATVDYTILPGSSYRIEALIDGAVVDSAVIHNTGTVTKSAREPLTFRRFGAAIAAAGSVDIDLQWRVRDIAGQFDDTQEDIVVEFEGRAVLIHI